MQPNTNTETGIRYGIISANNLDPEVIDQIQREGKDLTWEAAYTEAKRQAEVAADTIEDEVRIAIAERGGVTDWEYERLWEKLTDEAYTKLGFSDRDDFVSNHADKAMDAWYPDEPIHEFEIDGVKGRTTWLGGAMLVWVFQSPFTLWFRACSPCVPNAANLDSPDANGVLGYDVPADWRSK